MRWLLIAGGALYLAMVVMVGAGQRRMIYHPPRLTTAELQPFADRNRLLPWTNSAGMRIGWWRPSIGRPLAGTVLVTHGNAGSAAGREYLFDPLQQRVNADVFVLEYPGFADRAGEPTQESLLAAAREGLIALTNRGTVTIIGESLGSGVAAYLAGAFPDRVQGLILLVPYRELADAASEHFPWLPVRLLLRDRFPAHEWLRNFRGPLAVVVSGSDEIIPPASGRALFEGYAGPKRLWDLPGKSHWEGSNHEPEAWEEFWRFARTAR
jgi:uncharacterized protein